MNVNERMPGSLIEKFRGVIKEYQDNKRGWLVKNVLARGLHIPYALVAITSATVNTTLGLGSGILSVVLLGRARALNEFSDEHMESFASLLPNVYNAVLGIINPRASLSEAEIVSNYYKEGIGPQGHNNASRYYVHINPSNETCFGQADTMQAHRKTEDSEDDDDEDLSDFPEVSDQDLVDQDNGEQVFSFREARPIPKKNIYAKLKLSAKFTAVGCLMQAVALRTASLVISVLLVPLDIVALGSHKSLHNRVLQGLRAPGIVGDTIVYIRDFLN